jgi:hypothetical protein
MERLVAPAAQALAAACEADIDAEGGIPTRNPEELLEVLTLLTWSASAMSEANLHVPQALSAAITRIAPALRSLRHTDGELARFHGGDKGAEGRLDQALAAAGVRAGATPAIAMGYARLTGADFGYRRCLGPAGGTGCADGPCLDLRLRALLGATGAGGELRVGRGLRGGLAAGGAGDGFAFGAGDGGSIVLAPWPRGRGAGLAGAGHGVAADGWDRGDGPVPRA